MRLEDLRINKISLLNLIIFIFSPFLAFCFALWRIFSHQKGFFIVVLFFTVLGTLYPPVGDSYRHLNAFNSYEGLSLSQFLETIKLDFIVQFIEWFVVNLGLKFEFVRIITTFTAYSLILSIWKHLLQTTFRNVSKGEKFLAFVALMSCVFFLMMQGGVRFVFASVVFFSGSYFLLVCNKKKASLLVLLSAFIHYSFYPLLLAVLFAYLGLRINSRFVKISTSILLFIFGGIVLPAVLKAFNLPVDIFTHLDVYVTGYWSEDFTHDLSFLGLMALYLGLILFPPLIYTFYRFNLQTKLANLAVFITFYMALSYSFVALFIRNGTLVIPILMLAFLSNYDGSRLMRRCLNLLFVFGVLSYCIQIQSFRRQITVSDMPMIVYSSLPSILMHEYTKEWVSDNVNSRGGIKK